MENPEKTNINTKTLVERVRYAVNQAEKMDRLYALAALSVLEARLEAAERHLGDATDANCDLLEHLKAVERERGDLIADVAKAESERDTALRERDAWMRMADGHRVAELEERAHAFEHRMYDAERERDALRGSTLGQLVDKLQARVAELEELTKIARDLYNDAGVDDIDPRLNYIVVQIGREIWNDFVAQFSPKQMVPDRLLGVDLNEPRRCTCTLDGFAGAEVDPNCPEHNAKS